MDCQFSDALKPHYNDALRYCRALCAPWSASPAEDVLQQALLDAYAHFDELRDATRFKAWLFRIITRAAGGMARRRRWAKILPLDESGETGRMPAVYSDREEPLQKERLMRALSRLSSKEREAVLLFELGGFSLGEIRKIQGGRSLSATKSRLSRARRRLRALGCRPIAVDLYDGRPATTHDGAQKLMGALGARDRDPGLLDGHRGFSQAQSRLNPAAHRPGPRPARSRPCDSRGRRSISRPCSSPAN